MTDQHQVAQKTSLTKYSFDPASLLYTTIDNESIRLIKILGIGAYGIIYLGRDECSSKLFAVKAQSDSTTGRREAIIHSYLSQCRNTLKFERAIEENDLIFIIIEYAQEGDLFTALTNPKSLIVGNNKVIKDVFLQIIDAVQDYHSLGYSHRDLKPENIMLGENLKVKLADFGLSTATDEASNEFGCGSKFYFSPECQKDPVFYNGRGYDTVKNDIWSLGVILINLTTGRNPWKRGHITDPGFSNCMQNHRRYFRTTLPNLSKKLVDILQRIFCPQDQRISLAELHDEITRCSSFVTRSRSSSLYSNAKRNKRNAIITPKQQVACPARYNIPVNNRFIVSLI